MDVIESGPDARRIAAVGWAKLRAGDARGAAREFRAALAQDAQSADALTGLCQALLNSGETAAAAEVVRDLLALAPDLAVAHRLRALVLRRQRRPRKALQAARQAVRLDPREPYGHHLVAACLHGLGRPRAALKAIAEGRAIAPANAVLLAQQARLTLELRGAKAALPLIEEALRFGLESDYVLINAGLILLARGRLDEARDLLASTLRHDANQEEAISLYLLTNRKRYRLLRGVLRFRYWRKENRILGAAAWLGVWGVFVLGAGLIVGATQMSAGVIGLGYALFWRMQYAGHRREVRAHFTPLKLGAGF